MTGTTKSLVNNEWLSEDEYLKKQIFEDVPENLNYVKSVLGDSFDLVAREISIINEHQEIKLGILVMEGLTDSKYVNEAILENLSKRFALLDIKIKKAEMIDYFEKTLIPMSNVSAKDRFGDLLNDLLNGDTIITIQGIPKYIAVSSKGFKERAIESPTINVSVKGSRESFTENLATNISMIRRRMKNPNLWFKKIIIGKKTNCNIAIVYINGITDPGLIETIEARLKREEIESLVDSSYLKYYLKEENHSIFPLIFDTERPDTVIASLYEGRFGIVVDGSPFVLIAPVTFSHFLSSPEDYYNKSFVGSMLRIIRFIALLFALFLPGFYMCVVKFNSELLPINLMYSLAGQRANVPLPAEFEVIITLFAFDLLTEAGTRMPRIVGTALSFVGAIVIGQAAVEADLISSMMLIVVAVNGIGTLLIPDYDMSLTVKFVRYIILIFSILLGLFGFFISSTFLLIHLISLRSFGRPYMYPLAPMSGKGLMDSIIIAPLNKLMNRDKKKKGKSNEKN